MVVVVGRGSTLKSPLVDEDDEGDEGGRSGGEGNNEFVNPDTSQMNGVDKHRWWMMVGSGFFKSVSGGDGD